VEKKEDRKVTRGVQAEKGSLEKEEKEIKRIDPIILGDRSPGFQGMH